MIHFIMLIRHVKKINMIKYNKWYMSYFILENINSNDNKKYYSTQKLYLDKNTPEKFTNTTNNKLNLLYLSVLFIIVLIFIIKK